MIHIIFFSLFIFKIFAVDLIKAKECVTPYNEKATCSAISDCDVIKSALLSLTPQAIQFVKDSQCSCDAGMVCCGTSNDKYYQQLFNCVPVPEPLNIFSSNVSSSSVCGLDSSTDRIKGGSLVKAEEHPWLAAIEYKNKHTKKNAGIRCGGSLITERFVLTAAHCIVDVEFEIIKVWLGASNISSEETCSNDNGIITCINSVKKLNVTKTIPHECYNSINKYNDIGLLELEADLKLSAYIRPICIPSIYSNSLSIGTSLTVIGWGATENGKKSDVKLKVQVPMRGNKICEDYLKKRFRTITSNQLCAGGEKGKDSCEGDSGGPLMLEVVGVNDEVQWIQMGIVSYGIGCGLEEKPGVYIKVSSYEDWIRNKVTNNAYETLSGNQLTRTPLHLNVPLTQVVNRVNTRLGPGCVYVLIWGDGSFQVFGCNVPHGVIGVVVQFTTQNWVDVEFTYTAPEVPPVPSFDPADIDMLFGLAD